ncbi:carboxymuconolactone decarboxylase family protein [Actinomadura rupiterrae]|uniref:carboxymuconolactone decarboxylase family protein n=1 Tax=Actinomadura rupiterrae TaxID=559627 RepID=UPI0020A41F5F|nr:carboxymuconolactone decarboxylase family protein [Actinomadura rupiterrae]MCP2336074.1 AhpD family alkylhydroperoxidase [Actinomadura rupiterrae]
MTSRIVRRALSRSLDEVRHVSPVRPREADGLVARVYDRVERDFGMLAPPVALHSPAPGVLAASWVMLRESLVAGSPAGRPDRETVAAAVSRANTCPYCVAVHDAALHGVLPAGRPHEADEPRLERLAAWAETTGRKDAGPPPEPRQAVPGAENAQLVGVAVTFHYLNRMVNVFLEDSPVPSRVPARVHAPMRRLLGRIMSPIARRGVPPGDAPNLLPAAPPAADLGWAAADPVLADAFARAAAAIDAAGRRAVPADVRDLVAARLDGWDGTPPGPSRAWVDEAVAALPPERRPAGRLALLTALASYQVGPADVAAFRAAEPADRALVELTAWAALAAARRAGAACGPAGGLL